MKRGRPTKSAVRERIKEILAGIGQGYGYDIYRRYKEKHGKVTMRLIYYHLKKGVDLGELEVQKVETEKGDFSWGDSAEKVYYKLVS
ncbi:MAG: hypothetical protein KJ709_09335 [Nanoarchaeota archaeon]|nr:hypothetical protein [Nanoarchaeota archaeon]